MERTSARLPGWIIREPFIAENKSNTATFAEPALLVHCRNGADRSGLVSAIYLAEIQGVAVDEAIGQLSLYYGHFPWLISETGAMDESFIVRAPKILKISKMSALGQRQTFHGATRMSARCQ
jgi:hypothetical protein